jgi:hypothetical protein
MSEQAQGLQQLIGFFAVGAGTQREALAGEGGGLPAQAMLVPAR